MSDPHTSPVFRYLRRLVEASGPCPLSDAELLGRFASERDEAAFAALVGRHGGMVLGVCRRVLHDPHDAEDAFQATFLTLARKAGSIHKQASVASWLHGVARRLASVARRDAARRRAGEARRAARTPEAVLPAMTWVEIAPVLDEELGRMAEQYRAPLVLCYLEGRTRDEAARHLGCSVRTVMRRLERGRDLLRGRLARRGVTLASAMLTAALSGRATRAAVPPLLLRGTIKAAVRFAASPGGAAGLASAGAVALAKAGVKTMTVTKLQAISVTLAAAAVLGGVAVCAFGPPSGAAYEALADGVSPPPEVSRASDGLPARPAAARQTTALLASAAADAEAIEDPFQRAVAYCRIARAHARAGRRGEAVGTLKKALAAEANTGPALEGHKDDRITVIAECLAEVGDTRTAVQTVADGKWGSADNPVGRRM